VTSGAASVALPRPFVLTRVVDACFLATLFCVTFEKIFWRIAGNVALADILTILFLVAFALTYRGRVPRTTAIVLGFFAAFAIVYLLGFYNLETRQALDQYTKGMIKWALHFAFLAAGVTYLAQRGPRLYWRAVTWFTGGLVANAAYGLLQLLAARAGHNLDHVVLSPLTGGASSINVYGAVQGVSVYRPNALTGDPNHLGIMLDVPLLALTPVYLRLSRGHRARRPLLLALLLMAIVLIATLSRSGALGLIVGVLVLAVPYWRHAFSRALLWPLAGLVVVLAYLYSTREHFFKVVIRSRLQTGGKSTSAHLFVYNFVPHVLHSNPLLGLGLNTFSVYYQFVTGKTNWGPHSYWVALIVETGLIGLVLYLVFLRYVFLRLRAARVLGRVLERAGDPAGARVRPLAFGLAAAIAGTMAANFFYLTMSFYYFFAVIVLALALPLVFARRA
jgi:O-antigen ligase